MGGDGGGVRREDIYFRWRRIFILMLLGETSAVEMKTGGNWEGVERDEMAARGLVFFAVV